MSEDQIIRNCAPTLAGLKTGSIFTCPCPSRRELHDTLRQINNRLSNKGVRLIPLRFSEKNALLYLYRPQKLSKDLSNKTAARLLQRQGYDPARRDHCIAHLIRKLREESDFPHEIGLFLGYPAEDVQGFIEHNACGYKCVGCWKVYSDEESARKRFAQYKKCTSVYCQQWAKGAPLERLTVAG